jgi:hypothetical protein
VNGRNVLTLVVLKEVSHMPASETDPFELEEIQQLRVFKLVQDVSGGPSGLAPMPNMTGETPVLQWVASNFPNYLPWVKIF